METKQPRTIFDCINENIVTMSEDMNTMHEKVDKLAEMVGVLYASLVPPQEEEPNAAGDTSDIIE